MCSVFSSVVFDLFFFFKQKTAYEMRISDWSSDVCSSDLGCRHLKKIDVPPLEHKTMTTAKSFDICEILKLLPHRYPFLLVDRVLLIDEESMKLTAVKNVTFNEPF